MTFFSVQNIFYKNIACMFLPYHNFDVLIENIFYKNIACMFLPYHNFDVLKENIFEKITLNSPFFQEHLIWKLHVLISNAIFYVPLKKISLIWRHVQMQ
jgi:hypothetical protein